MLLGMIVCVASCAHKQTSFVTDYTSPEKTDLLRDRTNEFWRYLLNEDYKKAFYFFDPFFRGRSTSEDFLIHSGRIKYHRYDILDVKVEGNVGKVTMKILYSLPRFKAKSGTEFERPETENTMTDTWVYVYDTWYKQYHDAMTDITYTQY
jgi:hypothetical protein